MERLTKTYSDGTHGAADKLPCGENSYQYKGLLLETLGKYEDAEEQGLPNRWIPCSERLPEKYGTYLAAWKPCDMSEEDIVKKCGSPHYYEMLEYDPEDEAEWVGKIEQAEGEYVILAWMPLPKPYRESEGADG